MSCCTFGVVVARHRRGDANMVRCPTQFCQASRRTQCIILLDGAPHHFCPQLTHSNGYSFSGANYSHPRIDFYAQEDLRRPLLSHPTAPYRPLKVRPAGPASLLGVVAACDAQENLQEQLYLLDCSTVPPTWAPRSDNFHVGYGVPSVTLTSFGGQQFVLTNRETFCRRRWSPEITCRELETGSEVWRVGQQLPGVDRKFCAGSLETDARGHVFACDEENKCVQTFSVLTGRYLGAVLMQ